MMDKTEWVLLDTETDGLAAPIHVVEIAAQRMSGQTRVGAPFRVFLNHGIPIPAAATAIHGYTQEFLAENGVAPKAAYNQLGTYIETRFIVAHYLRYDWNGALVPEWQRLGIDQIGQAGFCSWMLSKRAIPELHSHRLDFLREAFGFPTDAAHSAIGDIDSLYALLSQVVFPRLEKLGISTFADVCTFSRLNPVLKCHCQIQWS